MQPKVDETQVLPVDDPPGVEVVEGLDDAGGVEAGGAVVKVAAVPQDGPELSAEAGVHEHVEVLSVLEGLEELDDEVAVGLLHDLLLRHDVLLLASLHDLTLLHLLQRERALLGVARDLHQLHAAEAAHAKSGDDAQVLQLQGLELLVDAERGNSDENK